LARRVLLKYTERMISVEPREGESINYESDPVLQLSVEDVDYRLDVGMAGTALSVSHRQSGSWDWSFIGQAKWDNIALRCKELPRPIRDVLAQALKANSEDGWVPED